jgi:hypothetical protein
MPRTLALLVFLGGMGCSEEETSSGYTDTELDWLRVGGAPDGRAEAEACDDYRDDTPTWDLDEDGTPDSGDFSVVGCLKDADCTDGMNGRCQSDEDGYELYCSYDECLVDEDCDTAVCVCGGDASRNDCVPSSCTVDSDCGQGEFCVQDVFKDCHQGGYHCMAHDAECIRDSDCPDDANGSGDEPHQGDCTFDMTTEAWGCGFNECDG